MLESLLYAKQLPEREPHRGTITRESPNGWLTNEVMHKVCHIRADQGTAIT